MSPPHVSFLHEAGDEGLAGKGAAGTFERPRQVPCFITDTNPDTHRIILGALDRSPLYTGVIEGEGPRYCPSIEDKVVRFADRVQHQIFIEPEGLNTPELYPNGISTSLPFDVQLAVVRSIRGFEQAHITRPGYAIEYDFFDPRDLDYSLETNAIRVCSSPARSMAPPAMKKRQPRVCLPDSMRRVRSQGSSPGVRVGMKPISVCWSMI